MRSSILRGDADVMVAVDAAAGGAVAGYVTYRELVRGRAVRAPTLLGRLADGLDRAATWLLDTLRRVLLRGPDHRPVDRRFDLIAHQQAAIFRDNGPDFPTAGPCLHVTWLAVAPAYQGRGVCSLLLRHGIAARLPLYLEASHRGRPVYLHKGFRELEPRFEIRDERGGLIESLPTMLRPVDP